MYERNRSVIDPLIKHELNTDPENRGYANATNIQKVELINSSYFITTNNPYFGEEEQPEFIQVVQFPRIYSILLTIPYAPNALTLEDLERLETE